MISILISIVSLLVAAYAIYINTKTINKKDSNNIELIRIKLMQYVPLLYALYRDICELKLPHTKGSFIIDNYGASLLKKRLQNICIKLEDFVCIEEVAECYYKELIRINEGNKNLTADFLIQI